MFRELDNFQRKELPVNNVLIDCKLVKVGELFPYRNHTLIYDLDKKVRVRKDGENGFYISRVAVEYKLGMLSTIFIINPMVDDAIIHDAFWSIEAYNLPIDVFNVDRLENTAKVLRELGLNPTNVLESSEIIKEPLCKLKIALYSEFINKEIEK